jgi:hypothetical protein
LPWRSRSCARCGRRRHATGRGRSRARRWRESPTRQGTGPPRANWRALRCTHSAFTGPSPARRMRGREARRLTRCDLMQGGEFLPAPGAGLGPCRNVASVAAPRGPAVKARAPPPMLHSQYSRFVPPHLEGAPPPPFEALGAGTAPLAGPHAAMFRGKRRRLAGQIGG